MFFLVETILFMIKCRYNPPTLGCVPDAHMLFREK